MTRFNQNIKTTLRICLFIFLITLLISSCGSKKFDELKNTNDSLLIVTIKLNDQLKRLEERITYLEQYEPDLSIKTFSDKEVIQLFSDHNKFYNKDVKFKDFKVLKTSYNTYDISYSLMDVSGDYLAKWSHGISRLTAHPNNNYKITLIKGTLLASP